MNLSDLLPCASSPYTKDSVNPVRFGSSVNIRWSAPENTRPLLRVYDVLGRERLRRELGQAGNRMESTMLDLDALQPGTYFLHIMTQDASSGIVLHVTGS